MIPSAERAWLRDKPAEPSGRACARRKNADIDISQIKTQTEEAGPGCDPERLRQEGEVGMRQDSRNRQAGRFLHQVRKQLNGLIELIRAKFLLNFCSSHWKVSN
jgi:hypothetical protein